VGSVSSILSVLTEQYGRAIGPVVARRGELERLGAHDPQAALFVARQAQARERHRLIEELQRIALALRAPRLDRALARTQAVDPQRSEERRVGKECRSRWSPSQ